MSITDRDPGDETLFDPNTVAPKHCPYCNVTRKNLCDWDASLSHGIERPVNRPKGCLASAQLAPDQALPYA